MPVTWNFPTRILFGEKSLEAMAAEVQRIGAARILIVSDPGVVGAGLAERAQRALTPASVTTLVYDGVASNPLEAHVKAASDAYRDFAAEMVIGLGGGSALDVAKLVRLCATHPLALAEYEEAKGGADKIDGARLAPMIAIPTTAGTGSEAGRSAVVTMADTNKKTVFFAPELVPTVAVLDPSLTVSMPPAITAATGFDALTHCVEAHCTKVDHPMADAIALEGIRLIAGSLRRCVEDGSDLEARGDMLKAAMMGGVAFQKGLGACHSLAHPLSAEAGMHHGLANALCLPAVVDFNRTVVPDKLEHIARLLGVRGDDSETLSFECSGALRALRAKVGLADGLASAGVEESALDRLAGLAFEDDCHRENPRRCAREDLLALYRASM